MRICLVSQCEPSPHQGGGKAQHYLAYHWTALGHSVSSYGPETLCDFIADRQGRRPQSPLLAFRSLVEKFSDEYDVIDFDHTLPLDRDSGRFHSLWVARSVLFQLHLTEIAIPQSRRLKHVIRRRLFLRRDRRRQCERLDRLRRTLANADIVNVSCTRDRLCAIRNGIPESKLTVFPFAIDGRDFAALEPRLWDNPTIVFLGSFDYRKGCLDTPRIFSALRARNPDLRMLILGAQGVCETAREVLSFFEPHDRAFVDVVMRFRGANLERLLSDCVLSIFPSYLEGFGFSVLETLAAGIPTIAYDSPGPCDILPPDWLVEPGDWPALVSKAVEILKCGPNIEASERARRHASRFRWESIACDTLSFYEEQLCAKRDAASTE